MTVATPKAAFWPAAREAARPLSTPNETLGPALRTGSFRGLETGGRMAKMGREADGAISDALQSGKMAEAVPAADVGRYSADRRRDRRLFNTRSPASTLECTSALA